MTGGRRTVLGMTLAAVVLVAAWQASADQDLFVGAAAQAKATSEVDRTEQRRGEPESPGPQSASLVLLGFGFALAAHSLKRQKSSP